MLGGDRDLPPRTVLICNVLSRGTPATGNREPAAGEIGRLQAYLFEQGAADPDARLSARRQISHQVLTGSQDRRSQGPRRPQLHEIGGPPLPAAAPSIGGALRTPAVRTLRGDFRDDPGDCSNDTLTARRRRARRSWRGGEDRARGDAPDRRLEPPPHTVRRSARFLRLALGRPPDAEAKSKTSGNDECE